MKAQNPKRKRIPNTDLVLEGDSPEVTEICWSFCLLRALKAKRSMTNCPLRGGANFLGRTSIDRSMALSSIHWLTMPGPQITKISVSIEVNKAL